MSYELGSSVHDTVELRDGRVINGDLESVSSTEVVERIGGKDARYDRNQIKRILLVERKSSQEALQPRGSETVKKTSRHSLPAISEEMKAWSAALEAELIEWPRVSGRSMFGFNALYRGKRIFAVLPRTRGVGNSNSLAFKLEGAGPRVLARLSKDPRVNSTMMRASRWFAFELCSQRDLKDALDWLGRAYEAAR